MVLFKVNFHGRSTDEFVCWIAQIYANIQVMECWNSIESKVLDIAYETNVRHLTVVVAYKMINLQVDKIQMKQTPRKKAIENWNL